MNEIWQKVLIAVLSMIATGLVIMFLGKNGVFDKFIKHKQSENAQLNSLTRAVQGMSRIQLRSLAKEYKDRGYCSYDEKSDWMNLYSAYHDLGKNGVMDKVKDEILALPTYKK